jgi:O-antigen/teichoic acid export membrane protein
MNINKKLLWGFIWRMFFSLSLFVLNIAFAKYFGAVESGQIYFITTALSLYIIFSSVNIETGIGFYVAAKKVNLATSLFAALLFTAGSVIILLILQCFPATRYYFSDKSWDWYYSVFFVTGNLLASIFCALFYAYNNYVWPNVILTGSMLMLAAFFFINNQLRVYSREESLFVYFSFFLAQAFILILGFVGKKYKQIKLSASIINKRELKNIIHYSLIALISNVVFFLLYRMDYWLVEYYASASELGNYIQASKFGQALLIAPSIFSAVVIPRIADKSIMRFDKPAAFAFILLTFTFLIFLVFLLFTGPLFFEILLGEDYIHMYWPSVIKIPAILFLSFAFVLGTWFAGINKVIYNIYSTIAGVVVIIVSDVLLIPAYGITGAAAASLLAYLAVLITSICLYNSKTDQRFSDLLLFCKKIFKNRKAYAKAIWANLRLTNY